MKLSAIVLTTAILLATTAHAESVRTPETGDPAITANLPDGWTHETDSGGLRAFSANHTALLTLAILRYHGTFEALAAGAWDAPDNMPPQSTGPVTISGYTGAGFTGALVDDELKAKIHFIAVRLDDTHVAAITLFTADNLDAALTEAANAVLATVAITQPPPPPPAPEAVAPATPPAASPAPEAPAPEASPAPEAPPPAKP